jgi:hypothetical protein
MSRIWTGDGNRTSFKLLKRGQLLGLQRPQDSRTPPASNSTPAKQHTQRQANKSDQQVHRHNASTV